MVELSKEIPGSVDGDDASPLSQIPSSGCTIVDLEAGVLRLEVLLGKMSYMIHLRE